MGRQIFGGNIKSARRIRLFLRDIDTADPRAVHPDMRDDISTSIRDGDVHRLSNLLCLLLSSCNYSSGII